MFSTARYLGPLSGDAAKEFCTKVSGVRPSLRGSFRVDQAHLVGSELDPFRQLLKEPQAFVNNVLYPIFAETLGVQVALSVQDRRDGIRWGVYLSWLGAPSIDRVREQLTQLTPCGVIANYHLSRHVADVELAFVQDAIARSWGVLPPEEPAFETAHYSRPPAWPAFAWARLRLSGARIYELIHGWLGHNVCPETGTLLGPTMPFPGPTEDALTELLTQPDAQSNVRLYAVQALSSLDRSRATSRRDRRLVRSLRGAQ